MTRSNLDRYRASMTEDQMQQAVAAAVKARHGEFFHVRRADASPELVNLPDWLILDPMSETVYLIEAKSQRRKITPGQAGVLALAGECNRFASGIVRPIPRPGEWSYDAFIEWLGAS